MVSVSRARSGVVGGGDAGGIADLLVTDGDWGWSVQAVLAGGAGLRSLAPDGAGGLVQTGAFGPVPGAAGLGTPDLFALGVDVEAIGLVGLTGAEGLRYPLSAISGGTAAVVAAPGVPLVLGGALGAGLGVGLNLQLGMALGDDPSGLLALGLSDGRVAVVAPAVGGVYDLRAILPLPADAGLGASAPGLCALARLEAASGTYLIAALTGAERIMAYRILPDGTAELTGRIGAPDGLAIDTLAALDTVVTASGAYVVAAAQGSSTLAVLTLDDAGRFVVRDQIMDSPALRLGGVTEVRALVVGGHAVVVAGGAEGGLSLFAIGPAGRLYHLATTAADPGAPFGTLSALEAVAKGDTLHLIAATQGAPSLTVLSVDLSDLGVIGQGADGYGTAADDILTATPDVRDLHGGAGRDLFVFGPEDADSAGMLGQVLDFEPGIDRLDLSGVPLLSSAGQVGVIATDDGATLTFRGLTLGLVTADKTPLNPAVLDDATLFDAMHPLFMPTQTVVDLSAFDATVFASPKGLPAGPGTPRDSFFTFLAKTEVPAGDTQTFADWAGTAPRIPEAAEIDKITPYFDLIL